MIFNKFHLNFNLQIFCYLFLIKALTTDILLFSKIIHIGCFRKGAFLHGHKFTSKFISFGWFQFPDLNISGMWSGNNALIFFDR